ncbi:hypothetical protein PLICRDRAFT_569432 [Plicaturopsis crispa FD-325 SS-3]|nr:hypothetical protein PLICRDRAFT_569432 [Plicaturopsis crispa FD-325 SS-3]
MASKQFTRDEVAKHNRKGDLWVVIDSKVFDLSRFATLHPGGPTVLYDEEIAGHDATEAFFSLHRLEVLQKPQYARLKIGTIEGEEEQIRPRAPGALSTVPYAEPTWLSKGYHSPYYKESHRRFQAAFRKFIDEVVLPDAMAREEDGKRPSQYVFDEMGKMNIPAMRIGPGPHLKGLQLMGGILPGEEFDYFHEMIICLEGPRMMQRGYHDGLGMGTVIALPPIVNFGRPEIRDKVVPDVLAGKKHMCLAISEAFAGSDVAGLRTFAEKSADGKYWTVNGTKKWITNGTFADYFTVACKTKDGFTVLLVERGEGVETKPIKTSYSATAGTSFVTFENVKVPIEHTLGPENGGLQVIFSNFNHERWVMACATAATQRAIVEECLKWVNQRKVFGKPLASQAVIRSKLAAMISRVESTQNWLENVTYQMCHMNYHEQAQKLAGQIALVKMHCTKTAQETAEDAVQIFGGRGITTTGMGRLAEHYHRTVTFDAVLGGAEDVLGDLGVRQAFRTMPKNARL